MALPAAFLSSVLDPRTLSNLIHNPNGHSPLTLPSAARGRPPVNAVPNAGGSDSVDLSNSGGGAASSDGRLAVNGSGLYRLVQTSRLSLSASSLSLQLGAGQSGAAERNALGVLSAALGGSTAPSSGLMGRFRAALEKLGLDEKGVRDLMLVGGMLEKLDPEAFAKFVDSMEAFATGAAGGTGTSGSTTAAAAPAAGQTAAAAGQSGASEFRLSYVSLSISMTEVTAQAASSEDGSVAQVTARSFELRFERLEISMSRPGAQGAQPDQQGDPVVLDMNGDGTDLRPTSDGVLFDLTGSGRPVRTAFVQGDDALLFYDANLNGLLDGGSELVGNRGSGLDGMADLASMDANGDGWVTPLDPLWQGLRIFQDWDGDGASAPDEIGLLDALGITGLSALWEREDAEEGEGLRRVGTSSFTRADGSRGLMLDYYFGYRTPGTQESQS